MCYAAKLWAVLPEARLSYSSPGRRHEASGGWLHCICTRQPTQEEPLANWYLVLSTYWYVLQYLVYIGY